MEFKDYEKYRWFFTSSEKLVIGGKSAEQNESLLKKLLALKEDKLIMHTAEPGSPFSVLLSPISKLKPSDIKECAIFTASFSQAWKKKKSKIEVHIFNLSQLFKLKSMKIGTWGVKKITKKISVPLSLVLAIQKGKLRAVPESAAKSFLLKIFPGEIDKTILIPEIRSLLNNKFSKEEILSALPAGGIKLSKK